MHLRGVGRQVGGHVQEAAGVVKATLEEVAEQASAAFSMASDACRRVSQTARASPGRSIRSSMSVLIWRSVSRRPAACSSAC